MKVRFRTILESERKNPQWRWRQELACMVARQLDSERLGVIGVYLIGSAQRGDAGIGSDLDLLVHFRGDRRQQACLKDYLDGWNDYLDALGREAGRDWPDRLIDYHIITDQDIAGQSSFAIQIDSPCNRAMPLPLIQHPS